MQEKQGKIQQSLKSSVILQKKAMNKLIFLLLIGLASCTKPNKALTLYTYQCHIVQLSASNGIDTISHSIFPYQDTVIPPQDMEDSIKANGNSNQFIIIDCN